MALVIETATSKAIAMMFRSFTGTPFAHYRVVQDMFARHPVMLPDHSCLL